MLFEFNDDSPIYLQIANAIEDGILKEVYEEESDVEELLSKSYCISGKAEDVEKFIVDKMPIAIVKKLPRGPENGNWKKPAPRSRKLGINIRYFEFPNNN